MSSNIVDTKIHTIPYLSEYMRHVYIFVIEVIFRSGTVNYKQLIELLVSG
jgi:hypothetical protein